MTLRDESQAAPLPLSTAFPYIRSLAENPIN
jgi:hypothetical protein